MKKLLIAFLAAILASGAFAQESFPDIPEGHWAGDAVDRIADMNIVIGFPDGTFRGNEAFTRYQAALVVSRLLDVISENMDAALAMTNEDIASLRNAVQELSSDVAAQGTRLSAAEGAIAGLSDDVTGQAARLDELEAALGDSDIDPAVLRDLQNQIASQRVAIDTAQATADQALARANAAGSQADANAQEIAALNELIQILGDQIEALEGAEPGVDAGLEARVARNEGDIANIREFVILLRRDQVALRDRVSALEASDEQQTADIADLQDRVTAIEQNPLGLSGEITLEYFSGRYSGAGDEFDIDRAYGVDFGTTYGGEFTDYDAASMGQSTFSSGTDDDAIDDDDEVDDPGEFAADLDDIEYGSGFDHDVDLTLDWANEFGGSGVSGLNSFEAVLGITIEETDIALFEDDDDEITETGYAFRIDFAEVNFDFIGGAALQFAFGQELDVEFTPYVLDVEDVGGLVATIDPGEFLAFLDPQLQVAYLTGDADDDSDFWTTGVRLSVSPLEATTIGLSYVMHTVGAEDVIGESDFDDTVFGVDVAAGIGPIDLVAEYANASVDEGDFDDSILFVHAEAEFDVLGGIGFQANYRDIADGWSDAVGSGGVELTEPDDYEFAEDQTGFGVEAEFGVFIVDLGAYFDSYTTDDPDAATTAFGVDAEAELFAGFSLTAFYESVSVAFDDDDADVVDSTGAAGTTRANELGDRLDGSYRTGFGVGLEHDGEAENALVPNLDLEFAFEQLGADFDETHILAQAGYDLDVSIVSLSPYVGFESYDDEDAGSDDTSTVYVGTGLETAPLDIYLAPSLEAAVNYRATSHTDVPGDPDYDATRLQWSVGLNLNEFLFDNSSLSARFGSYSGTNVVWDFLTAGDTYTGDETASVSGYELVWNYFDLEVSYGGYTNVEMDGDETFAQAFGISYTVVLD